MKIICTQAEKEWIIDALTVSPVCPFGPMTNFCWGENCRVCTEKSIEWEVTDGS